nr:hypothetical protein [Tanacetum cinerariifolium]
MAGEESSQPPQPQIASTKSPQMVLSVKLPILKRVILNGNSVVQMRKDEAGNEIEVPPITKHQKLARTRERKDKSTLLMAFPDEHLTRFHGIKDAKPYGLLLKPDLMTKGYDRFQRLLSLLEIHRAGVSTEDANKKFHKSLPSAWSNISLIMRNKTGIDNLDIDDLYNNLKVYKADIKGSFRLSSNSQNVAFVSGVSTNSTNELNAAYSVFTVTGHSSHAQEEEAIDFAPMAFTSNPSSSPSSNSKEEVTETVFDNRLSDKENSVANDRFKKGEGYHEVPPPLTGNYMPPKPELSFARINDSIYKFKISETVTSLAKDEKDAPKTSTAYVEKPKEDRMDKKSMLPTNVGKGTGHRESRPVWSNVQRTNLQKTCAPIAVFTRSGRIPVSAAKPKAAASSSATKLGHPQKALKNKGIVDSGCPRHITGNKAYLVTMEVLLLLVQVELLDESQVLLRVPRTPQQNGVAKRKNRTLIEAARTMLADSLLPVIFWAEAVNTACYVFNRALVKKTHNKTPYELLNDPLVKFEGKADEGFLVGYSSLVKLSRYLILKEEKLKRICMLGPQDTNGNAGTQDNVDVRNEMFDQHYIMLPLWSSIFSTYKSSDDKPADDKPKDDTCSKTVEESINKEDQAYRDELDRLMSQEKEASDAADALKKEFEQGCMDQRGVTQAGSINSFNTVKETAELQSTGIFNSAYHDELDIYTSPVQSVGAEDKFNNMESSTIVRPIPTHKVHIDHPKDQILGDPKSAVQIRGVAKKSFGAHAFVSYIHKKRRTNHKDYENCLFSCFLSQMEPKKAIRTKWVYKNKKDEKGIVVRNKAKLVAQGHRQEEGMDYDEVFASVAMIEATRIFLAFASFIGFIVYQMDVKSAFLYGTIKEEVSSTPIETQKPLVKDEVTADVDVYLYRSMIGSLMYLMASRPDIMFAICACSRDSPFDLEAYSDSDYAGANLDKKSTTGEYVAADHCCGHILWIKNQMLDYANNFMNTKIYIDNESTIYIVNNPVDHSKTKHIEIRNHFIRDSYEKKLIQVLKIHTYDNVADLLTKAFDVKTFSSINLYMADSKFVDQHNMVACLEKIKENAEFHQIVDFLFTCLINYALTVSPTVYASYIEQFRNTVISKTFNSVKQIHAIVDGKAVVISESLTLIKMRSEKAKKKGVAFRDVEEPPRLTRSTITLQPLLTIDPKDKDLAQRIYGEELSKLDRVQKERQKQEQATIFALTKEFYEIQARWDADHKLAEKGVAFRDVEEPPRLTRSTITLQPLLTIDLKDKDLAQRIYEEELSELDRVQKERQKQEQATIFALTKEFDEIQARWDADHKLAIDDFVPMDSQKEEKKSVEPESKEKKGKRIKEL